MLSEKAYKKHYYLTYATVYYAPEFLYNPNFKLECKQIKFSMDTILANVMTFFFTYTLFFRVFFFFFFLKKKFHYKKMLMSAKQ